MFPVLKIRKIKLPFIIGSFSGMSIYPFLIYTDESVFDHEMIHLKGQQEKFWKVAGPLGILAWLFLYLAVLPVGWNPFRRAWETEAYSDGSGYSDSTIKRILKNSYLLWW